MKAHMREIRRQHDIGLDQLAELAGLPKRSVYLLEIGWPTEEAEAWRVLEALSRLSNRLYTLDDVRVKLKSSQQESNGRREKKSGRRWPALVRSVP
ncbi:MAG: hypothetical protein IMW89_04750 [Ktedonobacteraceae bacterium]|nr:hypothetical protein [Ktedonobacteraceae bacterium]